MRDRFLTVEEVAELLTVPKSWIYERTRHKQIPCHKLGKYVRFDPREIEEWIENCNESKN